MRGEADDSAEWKAGCDKLQQEASMVDSWLNYTATDAAAREDDAFPAPNTSVLSVHRVECDDGSSASSTFVPIEPLVSFLRNPRHHCIHRANLGWRGYQGLKFDRTYLLPSRPPSQQQRSYFFDIGASLYNSGLGGASQAWFLETYRKRGVRFHRIFAWEAKQYHPALVYGPPMPTDVLDVISYFNVPVEAAADARQNPWRMLRSVVAPEDFVVVKLDVDTPVLEEALVAQLLEESERGRELRARVDEFYFEHHVHGSAMSHQGWEKDLKRNATGPTLAESYDLFSRLREAGIRAHAWV